MVLTTKEASYIIVLGIVISILPISSTVFAAIPVLCTIAESPLESLLENLFESLLESILERTSHQEE